MTERDRGHWNDRYRDADRAPMVGVPAGFADVEAHLPTSGDALDVACGVGAGAVWLALRGLVVWGVDGSDVAIGRAKDLAGVHGVSDRCHFTIADLDDGIPPGPPVDLITCHLFSAPALDRELVARLRSGGLLAITVLSEVGGRAGPYRAAPGALLRRFRSLEVHFHREGGGIATLLGSVTGPVGPNAA